MAEPSQETVGQRIRRLRLERGLSQRTLSGPGISYAYISRIESGSRRPSLKAMRHLARRLGVDLEYLETGDPIPTVARLELQLSDAELALRLSGDLDKAETLFASVLADVPKTEPALAARAQAGLGLLAAHRGDNPQAVTHLEQATGSGYVLPQARPDVYHALGAAYLATGAMDRATELYESVLDRVRAEDPPDMGLLIRFDSYLSWAYSELGKIDHARAALDEATALAEDESVAPPVRVNVYWELALHAWNEEADASAALTHMRRAIGLLEASEDTYQLARAHLLCAQLLSLDGRIEAAARHLARAEPLLVREGERSELGVLRAEQAKAAAHRRDAARALALAAEAGHLLGDDVRHVGLREHAFGAAYAAGGDIDRAAGHFDRAISDLAGRHQRRDAASVAGEWAKLLRAAGRQEEALEMFERAMQLSDRARDAGVRQA